MIINYPSEYRPESPFYKDLRRQNSSSADRHALNPRQVWVEDLSSGLVKLISTPSMSSQSSYSRLPNPVKLRKCTYWPKFLKKRPPKFWWSLWESVQNYLQISDSGEGSTFISCSSCTPTTRGLDWISDFITQAVVTHLTFTFASALAKECRPTGKIELRKHNPLDSIDPPVPYDIVRLDRLTTKLGGFSCPKDLPTLLSPSLWELTFIFSIEAKGVLADQSHRHMIDRALPDTDIEFLLTSYWTIKDITM